MKKNNKGDFEVFDGKLLHPSLNVTNELALIGFRYRSAADKEKNIFVFSHEGRVGTVNGESMTIRGKPYFIDKPGRVLARLEDRWSADGLKSFIKDGTAPNAKELFEGILALAKRYVDLEQEIDYDILVAWAVGGYFHPAFSAYPFLSIKAPKRSGKSQSLNFLSQICFNAAKARPTLAALSDTVDALRGTYLIDQADGLGRKGGEELLDVLADSYKASGGKRRIVSFDQKRGRQVLEFETYSPKAFASTTDLPEDLRDRCLVIQLIRSNKTFLDPDEDPEIWRGVRGKLYKILLTHHALIATAYVKRKNEYKTTGGEMNGRKLELWLPLEIILENFGQQEKIKSAKDRFVSQYGFTEYEPAEIEEATIRAVMGALQGKNEVILAPSDIAAIMDGGTFAPSDTPKQRAAKVGLAIKKFNLASKKMPRTKDGFRYQFTKERVENVNVSYLKTGSEPTLPTLDDAEQVKSEGSGGVGDGCIESVPPETIHQ